MARLNRYERGLYWKYNHPCHRPHNKEDWSRFEQSAKRTFNNVLSQQWEDDEFTKHFSGPRKGWGRGHTGYLYSWKYTNSFLKRKVYSYVRSTFAKMTYRKYSGRPFRYRDADWERLLDPKLLPKNKKLWIKCIFQFIEMQRASWPIIQKLPQPELLKFPPCKHDIETWYDNYSKHEEASKIFFYLFYYFSEIFWKSRLNLYYAPHTKERELLFDYVNVYKEVLIKRSERFALTSNKRQNLIEVPYQIIPSKTELFVESTFFYYSYNKTKLSRFFPFNSYTHWNWNLGSQKTTLKYGHDRDHSEIFNDLILSSVQDLTILYNFNLGYNSEIYFLIKYINRDFLRRLNKKNILTYQEKSFTFEQILETDWSCFEK